MIKKIVDNYASLEFWDRQWMRPPSGGASTTNYCILCWCFIYPFILPLGYNIGEVEILNVTSVGILARFYSLEWSILQMNATSTTSLLTHGLPALSLFWRKYGSAGVSRVARPAAGVFGVCGNADAAFLLTQVRPHLHRLLARWTSPFPHAHQSFWKWWLPPTQKLEGSPSSVEYASLLLLQKYQETVDRQFVFL